MLYSTIIGIIFLVQNVVIFIEAVFPLQQRSEIVQSYTLADFSTLFICFIAIGTCLIVKLKDYFGKNYQLQRKCLIKTLVLHCLATAIIIVRQSLELDQSLSGLTLEQIIQAVFDNDVLPMVCQVMFWFLLLAEYVPFVLLLISIWLSSKSQVNDLLYGYLYKQNEGDNTTQIGSVMFAELQEEIGKMSDHVFNRSQIFNMSDGSSPEPSESIESFQPQYFDEEYIK